VPIASRGSPPYFTGGKLTKLLQAEAATYLWHFDVTRNM
jgi:hypothetical protein